MPQRDITYQLLLSFAGLVLVSVLAIFPPTISGEFTWRKPLIGLIFSAMCAFGVLAVFSPSRCRAIFQKRTNSEVSRGMSTVLEGHHPICGSFSAHIFRVGDRTFCAACTGLLIGGLVAWAGSALYFFDYVNVAEHGVLVVLLGCLGVGFGLYQFKFRNLLRSSMNTVFVIGTLLVLIGIDESVNSLFFDLFAVCLIVFWLFTRISLSEWDHELICSSCKTKNCTVRE
jgi:hypothetical protein